MSYLQVYMDSRYICHIYKYTYTQIWQETDDYVVVNKPGGVPSIPRAGVQKEGERERERQTDRQTDRQRECV